MSYAVIFPGQGAAIPGAGDKWHDHPAWDLITEAEDLLDRPLGRLLLEADAEELGTTRASQLAVLLTSLMGWDALVSSLQDVSPETARPAIPTAFAGHSLGQITALIAARAVGRDEGLRLAAERADLSQRSADTNPGRMAALVGASIQTATQVCAEIDAWIANDNAPGQVVIAGTAEGLDQAEERAKALGVRRTRRLDVGHAFHTPLLADVSTGLQPLLDTLTFREPAAPIVANTDALTHTDPTCWPEQLSRHLVEPVLWRDCQQTIATLGVDTLIEVGPGRVLAGLAKRTVPDLRVLNVDSPESAAAAAEELSVPSATPPASVAATPQE